MTVNLSGTETEGAPVSSSRTGGVLCICTEIKMINAHNDLEKTGNTPLYDRHVILGAKMVPFAGVSMPLHYPTGILKEHLHTRNKASVFDVSHMGQISIWGDELAKTLETLVPGDIIDLAPWALRYTQLLNTDGGINDDLIVTNSVDRISLIVNAACKYKDLAMLEAHMGNTHDIAIHNDKALIAIQGPAAVSVLARHAPACSRLKFMMASAMTVAGVDAIVSRSGYTGEDGFEISVYSESAQQIWELLLSEPEVSPAGLGARDSLRLESGLCLYGHDINSTTSPIEAGLLWSIGKRRRKRGEFIGEERVLREIDEGPSRRGVGTLPEGKSPAREHVKIMNLDGDQIGEITCGRFGPSINGPIAMGYVKTEYSQLGTEVILLVREKKLKANIVRLPFTEHRYFQG